MACDHSPDATALSRRGFLKAGGGVPAATASPTGRPAVAQTGTSGQAPVREISRIAGNLYRFRNDNHYSVFAVTPEGVIATDPINAAADHLHRPPRAAPPAAQLRAAAGRRAPCYRGRPHARCRGGHGWTSAPPTWWTCTATAS